MGKSKRQQVSYKLLVCDLLGWDEQQYGEYVYRRGIDWIMRYFGAENEAIMVLENSRSYWAWWVNQWEIRDLKFIATYYANPFVALNPELFYEQHNDLSEMHAVPNHIIISEFNKTIKALQETGK